MLLAGCASSPSPAELDAKAQQVIKGSFRDQGIAKTDRLNQDLGQQACSSDKPPSDAVADQIKAEALYSVKWPTGGRYIGDWKAGEKLAQSGRGMTWTDKSADTSANGGNCYNCHQLDKAEISYGTIGPSLWNYGKTRGVTDPASPACRADRAVHLGQAVELEGLRGLLEHAALRPQGSARRKADRRPDGAAAGPEVAGQPVARATPPGRVPGFSFLQT